MYCHVKIALRREESPWCRLPKRYRPNPQICPVSPWEEPPAYTLCLRLSHLKTCQSKSYEEGRGGLISLRNTILNHRRNPNSDSNHLCESLIVVHLGELEEVGLEVELVAKGQRPRRNEYKPPDTIQNFSKEYVMPDDSEVRSPWLYRCTTRGMLDEAIRGPKSANKADHTHPRIGRKCGNVGPVC